MIYEYQCPSCNKCQEVDHKMGEDPEIKCSKCNTRMKRIISGGSGFILNGNGWPGKEIKSGVKEKK